MTSKAVHWAHIDAQGKVVSWGTAHGTDVFLQELGPGLTAVSRPEDVTGYTGHRLINGEWKKEAEQ